MSETFKSLVGQRLQEARKALGPNQAELAKAVGVSREQWGRYERGLDVPGGAVLAAAAGLGVDVRYVLTGSRDYEPPPALSAEEQLLLTHWRAAPKPVRNEVWGALIGPAVVEATRHVKQTIKGPVGHLTTGDMHVTDGRLTIQDQRKTYVAEPAQKKPRKSE